ncbi:hypothetical protein TRFO_08615 [Tritrichomonas foetus]|uniref:FHA domain-containing protein n=1 Tax=Tritrichomonas foetus TaxID=1144522 RepID=A0A1J4JP56_9EUKA|nr:hypothetical protein TRFO_08615 [Tritrichomonas foetus]|eukprot:OHS99052.1 hypothetical protein TRFO_08615 [Tritrichomonas foetus]
MTENQPNTQANPTAEVKSAPPPLLPQILPPVTSTLLPLSQDAKANLIINAMHVPFSQLQASAAPLEKYAQNELEQNFISYLKDPPEISNFNINDIKISQDFDIDEDYILLSYIKHSSSDDFRNYIKDWLYVFKPFRSIESIENRMNEIKEWNEEQTEQFYQEYTTVILDEKLFADSTLPTCDKPILYTHSRCAYEPTFKIHPSEAIDKEIDRLSPQTQCFLRDSRFDNCLAILRSEKYEFQMKNEAIMIGRGSADQIVDVEMNFVSEKPCVHISRNQAIISFLEDFNFYIENCGNRAFRVNGAIIPVGGMAILPPNAILDFSDSLLVFIPNMKLVNDVKNAVENPQSSSKSRKRVEA